jgi:type II secretory pathway pseudopilin PulG
MAESLDSSYQPGIPGSVQTIDRARSSGELKQGMAICSLVIGIIGFFTLGLLGIGAVVGIVLAGVALNKANRNPSEYGGKGFAIGGLVTNVLSIVIIVPIGIVAAIAIPNLMASIRAANEASSIRALRMISTAEVRYQEYHGKYGSLRELATDQLIDDSLGSGKWKGYRFSVNMTDGHPGEFGFEVVAVPSDYSASGIRSFYTDETGVIRGANHHGENATKFDSPLDSDGDHSPDRQTSRRVDPDAE